jgi:hypothetical protein
MLTNGVVGGALLGTPDGAAAAEAAPIEDQQVLQTLKQLISEIQATRRSALAGEIAYVSQLREAMLDFVKSTNKWPDMIDVGPSVFFTIYDWHVRFGQQPVVVRMPDNRYGITFMFTTLVMRPEQTRAYIGMPYDKEK